MGKAIVIASGKGGTGKTTATAAIASCLAGAGYRTLCIDADAGLKNLDLCLGLADRAVFDFGDVLRGRCGLEEAVVAHPQLPRLFFLTAPLEPLESAEDIAAFKRLVRFVSSVFDYCLIDAPAGLGPGFTAAAAGADSAVIVSASDPSSCRDSGRIVQELAQLGVGDVRLVVNRVRRTILHRARLTIDDAVDSIGARLLGVVPEDRRVILAAAAQKPLALSPDSSALAAFDRIALRLTGKKIPVQL